MANYIRFTDTVELRPIEILNETRRRDFVGTENVNAPLYVKIAATHAGIITRNNGFYLPDRMAKGAGTFTANYNKPIQVHHDSEKDPIGRVIKATYIDTSSAVKDKFIKRILENRKINGFNDAFISDFISGKTSYIQSVNFISDVLNVKDSILDDHNYEGLGYIQLSAIITDPEAKQKVLDGRYLTGSVGASTNRAVCSVCKQDWTSEDGRCEHKPGKLYDGAKAFIIAGDLNYDEYSLVNVPADRHSRILEVNVNGVSDSVKMDNSLGRTISVNIIADNVDTRDSKDKIDISPAREAVMDKEKLLNLINTIKPRYTLLDETDINALVTQLESDVTILDEDSEIKIEAAMDKIAGSKIFPLPTETEKLDALKILRPKMEVETLTLIINDATLKTAEDFYKSLLDIEWQDYFEGEDEDLIAYKVEHPEDAKLSTGARKKLASSTFCGPNRSFPVPDCAHVTAARRLIGRASVSSATKSRILGCVSRKSSALGCGSAKDSVIETKTLVDKIDFSKGNFSIKLDKYEAPIELLTLSDNEVIKGPGKIILEASFVVDLSKQVADLSTKVDSLNKQLETNVSDKTESEKVIAALREELKITHKDLVEVNDMLINKEETILSEKAQRIAIYKQLSGEVIEDMTKCIDQLTSSSGETLDTQLTELTTKVDMKKITDSINSGLARNPNGILKDPTLQLEDSTKKYDKDKIKAVEEEYVRIKFGGFNAKYGRGSLAADQYKADMQNQGIIPIK